MFICIATRQTFQCFGNTPAPSSRVVLIGLVRLRLARLAVLIGLARLAGLAGLAGPMWLAGPLWLVRSRSVGMSAALCEAHVRGDILSDGSFFISSYQFWKSALWKDI
jgi:hypothetical protein